MKKINITPITILGKTATQLLMMPFTYSVDATFVLVNCQLLTEANLVIAMSPVRIEDLTTWGTSDSVLVGKILTALNLTELTTEG